MTSLPDLKNFRKNSALHLKRTDEFIYVPDILVNSFYNPETEEVAAFEELIGIHGGMGGFQSRSFIMYPSNRNLYNEKIIGAEKLYKIKK